MKSVDLAAVQKIIEEVAAAEIMPRFQKLQKDEIEMKGANDPVTVADKAAEEFLTARLKDILPGSVVIGEEGCAKDAEVLSRIGGEDVWVIDPIDGTNNFIKGIKEFGVMVAHVRRRETVAAWIHDPSSGHTLMGEKGSGVWLQGKKMRLAGRKGDGAGLVIIGSRMKKVLKKPELAKVMAAFPEFDIGSSAAFDYARLFVGDVLFADSKAPRAALLLSSVTKPWDHVPGVFLQAEVGGYSADFFGRILWKIVVGACLWHQILWHGRNFKTS